MTEKITVKMDRNEIDRAQKLISETLEINSVRMLNAFGALTMMGIVVAQDGNMEKKEFMLMISNWWDHIEKDKENEVDHE